MVEIHSETLKRWRARCRYSIGFKTATSSGRSVQIASNMVYSTRDNIEGLETGHVRHIVARAMLAS